MSDESSFVVYIIDDRFLNNAQEGQRAYVSDPVTVRILWHTLPLATNVALALSTPESLMKPCLEKREEQASFKFQRKVLRKEVLGLRRREADGELDRFFAQG